MKQKLFTFFFALMAMCMFSPQKAWAEEPDYFTITNTGKTNVTVKLKKQGGDYYHNVKLSYSENGDEWTTETNYGTSSTPNSLSITLSAGQTLRFRGYNVIDDAYMFGTKNGSMIYWYFSFDASSIKLSGNIMSLVAYQDNEIWTDTYPLASYCFEQLFKNCTQITDISLLELPSKQLGSYCYDKMFSGCSGITSITPALPATTLQYYCYDAMFSGCKALTSAPALPAMTLATGCYYSMFNGCVELVDAPTLPATDLKDNCYGNMFQNCSKLKNVQAVLPGTNLPASCYQYMFDGCAALETAPEIMAGAKVTVSDKCMDHMFANCSALTKAPSVLLPEKLSGSGCVRGMFDECKQLTKSPTIMATDITGGNAADYMFRNCEQLNHMRIYRTSFPSSLTQSNNWVKGVSTTGTIYCPPTLNREWNDNNSKMPRDVANHWTVYSYDITFVPKGGTWADKTTADQRFTWETDVENVENFLAAQVDNNESLIKGLFLDENLTQGITMEEFRELLKTQQETSTKNIYVSMEDAGVTKHTISITTGTTENHATATLSASGYYPHNINSGTYRENTTVTATINVEPSFRLKEWDDTHSTSLTREIIMSKDINLSVTIVDAPKHTVTFKNYDGTKLETYQLKEDLMPEYHGKTPTRGGNYRFNGWDKEISAVGSEDVTYTATYREIPTLFTITNTDESKETTVKIQKNSGSAQTLTLYIRTTDGNGNVGEWIKKDCNTNTTATSLGVIPVGGKMEMYGSHAKIGSTTSNYSYFLITGGTASLSGNILSLVACSDGVNIDNNFTIPERCFHKLFNNSSNSVTNAEDLIFPKKTGTYAYQYMFYQCSNLVKGPAELPATDLSDNCYTSMFQSCSSLLASPDIKATTHGTKSLTSMFNGASSLKRIRTHHTTWGQSATWVVGVPTEAGDFYCPPSLPRQVLSTSALPSTNWIVYSYDVTFIPKGGDWAEGGSTGKNYTWQNSYAENVETFLNGLEWDENYVGIYTDEKCTTSTTKEAVIAGLPTPTATTEQAVKKTYYISLKASAPTTHTVTITTPTNGSIKVMNGQTEVKTGDKVDYNTTLTITATPSTGYHFDAWTNDNITTTSAQGVTPVVGTITIDGDETIGVTFAIDTHTLTVDACTGGTYTVKIGEAEASTATAEKTIETIPYGTQVTLKAFNTDNFTFTGWQLIGGTITTNNSITFTMAEDVEYQATFESSLVSHTLTLYPTMSAGSTGDIQVTGGGQTFTSPTEGSATYTIYEGVEYTCKLISNDNNGWGWWLEDGFPISSEQEMKITPTDDVVLYAGFGLERVELDGKNSANSYGTYENKMIHELVYLRTFTAKNWFAMWMPFNFDVTQQGLSGKVYTLSKTAIEPQAEGIVDVVLTFHKYTSGSIEAGERFLLYSAESAPNFVFQDIMMTDFAPDNDKLFGDAATHSEVYFIGAIEPHQVGYTMDEAERKSYRYLKNNVLYYPANQNGIKANTFTGYFQMKDYEYWYVGGSSAAPRMRIIVDDETVITEAEMDNEVETRKYINDEGNLIIERNGTKYTANGAVTE